MAQNAFDFSSVTHWVFDLDNTLYSADSGLFSQVDVRMTDWIARTLKLDTQQANTMRLEYWKNYGTTLSGLMKYHAIDPDDYLHYVHDIDLSEIASNPSLAHTIRALPGKKVIYTNGSRGHAERVLKHLGLEGCFDKSYAIEDTDYIPKPAHQAFEMVFNDIKLNPATSVMLEDTARNLKVPYDMGMQTVWIQNDDPIAVEGSGADYILHKTGDLQTFLSTKL